MAASLPYPWAKRLLRPDVLMLEASAPILDLPELDRLQRRLGGTLRLLEVGDAFARSELGAKIEAAARAAADKTAGLELGVSVLVPGVSLEKSLFALKKQLRAEGVRVRIVLPQEGAVLSTAQVGGNKLAAAQHGAGRIELMVLPDGESYRLARTLTVQDIEDYTLRDFKIPNPDPLSGMLNPKVAQTMLNLAIGKRDPKKTVVYDPFCGNGRIMLEARLMGATSFGSDISTEKVDATRENLRWLATEYSLGLESAPEHLVWDRDATKESAVGDIERRLRFGHSNKRFLIVSEPYLGKPYRSPLSPEEATAWQAEVMPAYERFLGVWANSAIKPYRMVLVFPRAKLKGGKELALLAGIVDRLSQMGYHADMVAEYGRPDAVICRDIVVLSPLSE